jgi:hypothetical protein
VFRYNVTTTCNINNIKKQNDDDEDFEGQLQQKFEDLRAEDDVQYSKAVAGMSFEQLMPPV